MRIGPYTITSFVIFIHVFTVTFDQLNMLLLNKALISFNKINKQMAVAAKVG